MALLFLDRDGVINQFPGKGKYVTKAKDFKLLKSSLKAIADLTKAGYELHIISNQGCVSRGLITKKNLSKLTQQMLKAIRLSGGKIKSVQYCYHQTSDQCECKKPKIKLLQKASKNKKLQKEKVYFIGDSPEDIGAGHNFGCKTILVLSGRTKKKDVDAFVPKPHYVHKNLREATRWLLEKKSS